MGDGLRARLIGAWKLVAYQEIPVDGSEPFEPLGHEPQGIIMYTPDGYMSAQLSKRDRPTFASGDWFEGTTEWTRTVNGKTNTKLLTPEQLSRYQPRLATSPDSATSPPKLEALTVQVVIHAERCGS
jgi:hypothetical protein